MWAVPNAITAWVLRSGYVTGTPAQLRQWTIHAFSGINLVLGFFVTWGTLLAWLIKVMSYRRTGGLVPMPQQTLTPRQHLTLIVRMVPILAWCVVASSWRCG